MNKRILLAAAAIVAIVTAAVWFAAEESYVLRLNAELGTALNVDKHGEVKFGSVYGQEVREQTIRVALSHHAQNDPNLDGVDYSVTCKPNQKVVGPFGSPPKLFSLDDICQYTTGDLGTFKLFTGGTDFLNHTVRLTFPDCAGSTANPDKAITTNCTQDSSVVLGGSVNIVRTGLQGTIKKIVCNEKDDNFPCANSDVLVDCDGIASRFAGCTTTHVQVKKGSPLSSWPTSTGFGPEGIDTFDRDSSGGWSAADDIHLEGDGLGSSDTNLNGACTTGIRVSPPAHDPNDCKVLDLNNDLFPGILVNCDLETGTFCTGTMVSDLKFFDANGSGDWNNGEDIVLGDTDGIFN